MTNNINQETPMTTSRIHLSIAFGDAILPVIACPDGFDRVPLKPIIEQIGVDWRNQRRKFANSDYITKRMGIKVEGDKTLTQEQICIRFDRVTAFLNTLNPENIRGMGNSEAADWLEAKHQEWDDALHAYETTGFAGKRPEDVALRDLKTLFQMRDKANAQERAWLTQLIASKARDMGVSDAQLAAPQGELALEGDRA